MQGHGRIIAPDFCVAHREANSGLSTLNRTKSMLSIYHQQRQLQKQRGMCLNDTYPFCQQPLSGNCHSICFSKPVLWAATPRRFFYRWPPKPETTRQIPKQAGKAANGCGPACFSFFERSSAAGAQGRSPPRPSAGAAGASHRLGGSAAGAAPRPCGRQSLLAGPLSAKRGLPH